MDGSAKHRRMLNRLKALSLLAPDAVILTSVADSDVIVAHKNGTDRDVGSLGRPRSIRSPMDLAMKVCQLLIQARLVLFPRHAIDAGRGFPLQGVVAVP